MLARLTRPRERERERELIFRRLPHQTSSPSYLFFNRDRERLAGPTEQTTLPPHKSPAALGRACLSPLLPPLLPPTRQTTHARNSEVMTNSSYLAFLDEPAKMMSRTRVPGLSALPILIPHRLRRKWRATRSRIRSRQSPTSSIASLETSFSPADTLRSLRTHPWSIYDGQYLVLAIVAIFSLCVSEAPGPFAKTFAAAMLMAGLVLPISRQFLLPFLPALAWLYLFASAKYVCPTFTL
jgi:hypothetical protein